MEFTLECGSPEPNSPLNPTGADDMSDMERAAACIKAARNIVFFTGAGISAESGIPTYRDELTGLWSKQYSPQLETANAFRASPALVWGFYLWRRNQVSLAKPNAAHVAITSLATSARHVTIVTQNIDDLHERAGSTDVIHLHGSLKTPKCFACARPVELDPRLFELAEQSMEKEPPRCVRCNGRLRPGVVWFGEDLPAGLWKTAMAKVRNCDALISVGTSGVVTPAAAIPEIALSSGAIVVHVNIAYVSLGADKELMVIGKASEAIPALLRPCYTS